MNDKTINNDVTMDGRASVLAGRYRIIKQLGQGGMGSVWLAEDTQLDNKLFAIKMLPSILVSNKRAYAQLKSEALVAMKLVHPNIVQIRAFEENNGNPFLVMDYIDGETLDDWLGDRGQELGCRSQELGVSEEVVVKLLKPIAEALDYAHTEGVVHRDIKPANVMIRKDGRPFIMDFGIAREIQETLTRVTGKLSSGTLLYMSPEQLNGDMPKKEQDIYSFAAMVYECLKGELPFCRGAIEDQIKNKTPEVLGDNITVASSVMAGLAKKPEERPKSCVEVLEKKFNRVERVDRVEGIRLERGNKIDKKKNYINPGEDTLHISTRSARLNENAEKKFLIIGNMNAITYKEVFPLIKDNRLWLGESIHSGDREFGVPKEYPLNAAGWRIDEQGNHYIRVKGVRWFTNLEHGRRHQPLQLMTMADNIKFSRHKDLRGKEYQKYDNYDAIEVPFTDAIPSDYDGVMGVPISFLDKYCPEQFEIVKFRKGNDDKDLIVNGICPYFRILIRHRKDKL